MYKNIALIALLLPFLTSATSDQESEISVLNDLIYQRMSELRDLTKKLREVSYDSMTCEIIEYAQDKVATVAAKFPDNKNRSKQIVTDMVEKEAREYGKEFFNSLCDGEVLPIDFYEELTLQDTNKTLNLLKIIYLEKTAARLYAVGLINKIRKCTVELNRLKTQVKELQSHE
jgi:hypothetical protein